MLLWEKTGDLLELALGSLSFNAKCFFFHKKEFYTDSILNITTEYLKKDGVLT